MIVTIVDCINSMYETSYFVLSSLIKKIGNKTLNELAKYPIIIIILMIVGTIEGLNQAFENFAGELTTNIVPNAVKNDPKSDGYILKAIKLLIHVPIIHVMPQIIN